MGRLSNIPLSDFRRFLETNGLKEKPAKGGHEKWIRSDLLRPVIVQSHIDPVPEFIVKNCLKNIGVSDDALLGFLGRK